MRTLSPFQKITIFADFIIIILCAIGVYNFSNKAALPFNIKHENLKLVVNDTGGISSFVKQGDLVLSVDNLKLETIEEIELLLDGINIDESINIEIQRADRLLNLKVKSVPYYSKFYIIVAIIVGLMFILVSIVVILKCDVLETALSLHWSLIFTAMIILMTWGNFSKPILIVGIITRAGFHLGYLFAPIFFLRFVTLFPSKVGLNTSGLFKFLFGTALLLFIILNYTFLLFSKTRGLSQMRGYVVAFDLSSIFVVLVSLSAILIFIQSYRHSSIEIERKKIRWILLGFILGPLSYFALWVIPSRVWNNPILPEPVVLLLVSFVPITFGIAIIKYRVLNIDIIFKRGLVYLAVITFLLLVYIGILTIFAKLLNRPDSEASSILAAISIALLFQPLKNRVRRIVNKKFFHVEYDYRQSVNSFLTEIKDFYKVETIVGRSIDFINEIIPTSNIGFLNYELGTIKLHYGINFSLPDNYRIQLYQNNAISTQFLPMAKQEDVESEAKTNPLPDDFADLNASVVYIIKSSKKDFHGMVAIGRKKSGLRFTLEDIDLLTVITTRLSIMLDRIKLQEEVIREHLEAERLEELNKLKSYFVSSVSHDLKTPLTSIKMFAEILKSAENIPPQKSKEYLDIIEGESNRLTRLIDNVLDYSKIERGVKKYNFKTVEINKVVEEILKLMEYQFKIKTFNVVTNLDPSELFISADRDAIIEAIINIISNSIKFSEDNKSLVISTQKEKGLIIIKIADKGVGIPNGELEKIFEPFIKSEKISIELNSGAGLGLSIVKHIMEAHKGKIKIKSKVSEGTVVSLEFPTRDVCDNGSYV